MSGVNPLIAQNLNAFPSTSPNQLNRSGAFAKVFYEAQSTSILQELQERYSGNLKVTFTIAPEASVKMTQDAAYKKALLREINSFLSSPFVKEHTSLSFGVQIDSNGKIAYSIEVLEREESDQKDETAKLQAEMHPVPLPVNPHSEAVVQGSLELIGICNQLKHKRTRE